MHKYPAKGGGSQLAVHERRETAYRAPSPNTISMDPISEEPSLASRSTGAGSLEHPRPQHANTGFPSIDAFDSTEALRTAPADLYGSQRHPVHHDPFDEGPATAAPGAHFSSFSSAGSVGSATVPLASRSRFASSSPEEETRTQRHVRPHGQRRVSSGRVYPKGEKEDDKEESVSLVREPSLSEGSSPDEEEDVLRQGGIRLVGDPTSSNRF